MFEPEFLKHLLTIRSVPDAIEAIREHVSDRNNLDIDDSVEEESMDTLGNLIDKLTTVNSKLWHNQEELYKIRKMNSEEFVVAYGQDLQGLHKTVSRCCDLNVQRAKLMDEIDKFLSQTTGNKDVVREQHKMY